MNYSPLDFLYKETTMDKKVFNTAFKQIEESMDEFCRNYCRYSDKDSDKFVDCENITDENSKCRHCPLQRVV